MGANSKIEWTDATWNPWQGCHRVSAGCDNCYMMSMLSRFGKDPEIVVRSKTTFSAPLRWKEPRRVFTCSMSDFFMAAADPWRDEAWDIIRRTPQHAYQILTKRPHHMLHSLPPDWGRGWPHVWLGVSVEDQRAAYKRIHILMRTPAAVRFLSVEPMLEQIDLSKASPCGYYCDSEHGHIDHPFMMCQGQCNNGGIHWVICGGESGRKARPMNEWWVRSLKHQCEDAGVAFFMKQGSQANWPDFKNFDSFPEDLQVREFPR